MLKELLSKPSVDIADISATLDALDEATLVNETRTLGLKEQGVLYKAAKGFRQWTLEDMVPSINPAGKLVFHAGKNTLPAFSHFQKRFARPTPESKELWGFNEHTFRFVTGPGYFLARDSDGEVLVDYNHVPPSTPAGWPKVHPNTGLNSLTYGKMIDTLRGVSRRVSIGHADRQGKSMGYFVLVRLGG